MTKAFTKITGTLVFSLLFSSITFASFPEKFDADGFTFQQVSLEQTTQEIKVERETTCRELAEEHNGSWQVTLEKGLKEATFVPADKKKAYDFFLEATEEEFNKSLAMNAHIYEVCQGGTLLAKLKIISAYELQKLSNWHAFDGQSLPTLLETDLILGLENITTKDPLPVICAFMKGFFVEDRAQHRLVMMREILDEEDLSDAAYARFLSIQCHLIAELQADPLGKVVELVKPDPVFVPARCGSKLISKKQAAKEVKPSALYSQRENYELFVLTKK